MASLAGLWFLMCLGLAPGGFGQETPVAKEKGKGKRESLVIKQHTIKNAEVFEGARLDRIWPDKRKFGCFYWQE
jgi:hypothetical protein